MKKRKSFIVGAIVSFVLFILWTALVRFVDVQSIGPERSKVGFASINAAFHELTGYTYELYKIIDKISYISFVICAVFFIIGLVQWIKRKHIARVDMDIIYLGVSYVITLVFYVAFEKIVVNYRPVIPEDTGVLEASYPSSTTLMVIVVFVTTYLQVSARIKNEVLRLFLKIVLLVFGSFMVIGRLTCGVHWLSDIIGGVILSLSIIFLYLGLIPGFKMHYDKNKNLVSE